MPKKYRHVRIYIDVKVYTKVRKMCDADDAETRFGHSLRQDETVDILEIA